MEEIDETLYWAEDSRLEHQTEHADHDKAPKGFKPDPDALKDPEEPEEWKP